MMSTEQLTIAIPDDLDFAELKLTRDADGMVSIDWVPIERICAASGIDCAVFRDQHEDNVSGLIVAWYAQHLAHGGAHDPVQDDLIAEMLAEDARGDGISHQPGRA